MTYTRVMKTLLVCLLVVAACSKNNPNATKPGTQILDWKLEQSDRETIRHAATSEVKVQDIDYVAHPTEDTDIKLKIHLETATVTYQEAGQQEKHAAPIKLSIVVVDNGNFTVKESTQKCSGPHYQLGAPGEAPHEMLMNCYFHATKPNYDVGFHIYAWGAGKIDDGAPKKTKVM